MLAWNRDYVISLHMICSFTNQKSVNSFIVDADLKIWGAYLLFLKFMYWVSFALELYGYQDKTKSIFILFMLHKYFPDK